MNNRYKDRGNIHQSNNNASSNPRLKYYYEIKFTNQNQIPNKHQKQKNYINNQFNYAFNGKNNNKKGRAQNQQINNQIPQSQIFEVSKTNAFKQNSNINNLISITSLPQSSIKNMNLKSEYHKNNLANNSFKNKSGSVFYRTIKKGTNLENPNKLGKYVEGTIGLVNIGNICYLNSVIQNLKNIFPLTVYLFQNIREFNPNGFVYKYCELIANLVNQDTNRYISPKEFFSKLCDLAPVFRFGEQYDSNISLIYILNLLEKETRKTIGKKIMNRYDIDNIYFQSLEEKKKFYEFSNKLYENKNSIITDLFFGIQEDKYICKNKNCNYINYTFQNFCVLNLPIMTYNNTPIKSLENSIQYYQYGQMHIKDEDFYCSKCQCKDNRITTSSTIFSLPKILIINLKRVGEKDFYKHNVEIPENIKLNNKIENIEYEYELIGLIKHFGDEKSGHNVAFCKNYFDNKWYEYNDRTIIIFNSKNCKYYQNQQNNTINIDTSNGFLFFYKRKNLIFENNHYDIIINQKNLFKKILV